MDPSRKILRSQTPSPEGDRSPMNYSQIQRPNDFSGVGSNYSDEDFGSGRSYEREQSVFDAYRQIGSELKHSLKAFENHNQALSCQLDRLRQEIELLKRKREIQKNTLVELQIRAEELDHAKQLAIAECVRDKERDVDYFTRAFNAVCENDKYLTEAHGKIKEILEQDKKTVLEEFIAEVREERENQLKASAEYKEKTESMFSEYCTRIQNAIELEKKTNLELDEAIQQCKNNASVKEKFEYELQEKHNIMKLIENEVDPLKEELRKIQEEMKEVKKTKDKLNDELVKTHQAQSEKTAQKQEELDKLMKDIALKSTELKLKESKLDELMKEHNQLLGQINVAESQKDELTGEINVLNSQIDDLNKSIGESKMKLDEVEKAVFAVGGVQQMESEFIKKKNELEEKLNEKKLIAQEWIKKLDDLEEKWVKMSESDVQMKRSEEELGIRNENAKKELNDLMAGMNEIKTCQRLGELDKELSDLKAKSAALKEQILSTEQKLSAASNEIVKLEEENAALDRQLKEVCERDETTTEKFEHFQEERRKLDDFKKRIAAVREEVRNLKASNEFGVNVEQLREEVKKVEQEIEDKRRMQIAQKEATETSFNKTATNLQEQIDKLKQVSEEEKAKHQAKIDKLNETLPQLNRDIASCKSELVRTTEKNIAMMRDRIQLTRRLTDSYKSLQARAQSSRGKDFTVIRMLGTVEEHLETSFRGMSQYLQLTTTDFSNPSYLQYKRTLDAFENRFTAMTARENLCLTDPVYLEDLKNAAFALFGLSRYTETVAGSESTIFSPTSSRARDF